MNLRSKLIIFPEHVILAVVADGSGAKDELISATRIPRADWQRLIGQAATLSAGAPGVFYGDGAGPTPGELPLQPATPTPPTQP